ncbi:MAG: DUF1385 domain-containing protein [Nitrospirota bacterium]
MKNIGGQAVIEGVMMKGRRGWTVAVRGPKGDIHVRKEKLAELPRLFNLPMIRGVIALFHALFIGVKAIEFSAGKAYETEDGKTLSPVALGFTVGLSLALGVLLFILLPLYATKLLGNMFAVVSSNSFVFNLVDGLIRIFFFLLYIIAVGLWREMRRIFEYHGAEHKVIHAYESGSELTLNNIRTNSPLHPRCGTSFLLIVMITSILIFSFIPQDWTFTYKFLSRLILIPLIAGLSYELLRLSARMKNNMIIHLLILPGLLLQKLTTREPDDSQIEVALRALEEVLAIEEGHA